MEQFRSSRLEISWLCRISTCPANVCMSMEWILSQYSRRNKFVERLIQWFIVSDDFSFLFDLFVLTIESLFFSSTESLNPSIEVLTNLLNNNQFNNISSQLLSLMQLTSLTNRIDGNRCVRCSLTSLLELVFVSLSLKEIFKSMRQVWISISQFRVA